MAFKTADLVLATPDGFDGREIVFDMDTRLDLVVQLRRTPAAVTDATVKLACANGSPLSVTPNFATPGLVYVTITPTHQATLGLALFGQVDATWEVQVTDNGVVRRDRFYDKLWVATRRIVPTLAVEDILGMFQELDDPEDEPDADWIQPWERSYRSMRNWLSTQGGGQWAWMIQNSQGLRELEEAYARYFIARQKKTSLRGSKYWEDTFKEADDERKRLRTDLSVFFQKAPINTTGEQPIQERGLVRHTDMQTGFHGGQGGFL